MLTATKSEWSAVEEASISASTNPMLQDIKREGGINDVKSKDVEECSWDFLYLI